MNLEKLKDTARKYEQKEDWRRAIEVYLKAIQEFESGREPTPDLSLYNRVGDLQLKLGDSNAAVRSYERAVDLYTDQGFYNNAIALCGKILRVNPSRVPTYLKLAFLHARKNVLIEAKRNLIEYLERMNAIGQLDEAFGSVKEFADQFSGDQEIRFMLVELLRASSRTDEAREQLERLAGDLDASGDAAGAEATRAHLEAIESGEASPVPAARSPGLVFLDTGTHAAASRGTVPTETLLLEQSSTAEMPTPSGMPEGVITGELQLGEPSAEASFPIERAVEAEPAGDIEVSPVEGFSGASSGETLGEPPLAETMGGFEATSYADTAEPVSPVPQLDGLLIDSTLDVPAEPSPDLGLERAADGEFTLDAPSDDLPLLDVELEADLADAVSRAAPDGDDSAGPALDLDFIDSGESIDSGGRIDSGDRIAPLEDRVLDDPGNPERHRELGDALLAAGEADRAREELELALDGFEQRENWSRALSTLEALLRVARDDVRYHQKRVELAYRSGGRPELLAAYLSLADSLARMGEGDKASAVYGRVLEHDPANAHARTAIAALVAPPPAPLQSSPPVAPPAPTAAPKSAPPAAPSASKPPKEPKEPKAPGAGFVDLGSLVMDDQGPRDTRMRLDVNEDEASGDEQRDFEEMLAAFKKGIEENLDSEDYEAHYDLGVAFKEMGLLDEAIAEFQKALRAPEGRLRTSEALGLAFFEKRQFAVAEAVLRRAVDGLEGGDDEKIGLIYWLGRAAEEQGRDTEALAAYQRAMAVDIRFMDLGERIGRLTSGRRQ